MDSILLKDKHVPVRLIRKNIRHAYLRVRGGILVVTSNRSMKQSDIQRLILKHQDKILKILEERGTKSLVSLEDFRLFGTSFPVVVFHGGRNSIHLDGGMVRISITKEENIPSIVERFYIEQTIKASIELLEEFRPRIMDLLPKEEIVFKAQLMKSRFGSCNVSKRIIKLNSLLARLDKVYLSSTLCHELVHFRFSGHDKAFYQRLESLFPGYAQVNQELKKIHRRYEV